MVPVQLEQRVAEVNWQSLLIVGTAKNAGKTTVLNYLYRQLYRRSFPLGLMSTGRDGEATDLVTNEPKPRIWVQRGTWVATAQQALAASRAGIEVQETLPIATLHGPLALGRVREAGEVELIGPGPVRAIRGALSALRRQGAERVLVDGSMDRRAAASPRITGHVVLVSGASLAPELGEVVRRTAYWVELLNLPALGVGPLRHRLERHLPRQVSLIGQDGQLVSLRLASALAQGEAIARAVTPEHAGLVVPGALTDELIQALRWGDHSFDLIVPDSTCVFVGRSQLERFRERGGRLRVLHSIRLLALCVNPVGPQGVTYPAHRLVAAMAEQVQGVPIFDVVSGIHEEGVSPCPSS